MRNRPVCSLLAIIFMIATPAVAQSATPTFSKVFAPSTVGPQSASQLQYTISNGSSLALTGLSFSETLPSGLTIASPARARTTCTGGVVTAMAGETDISLSDGILGSNGSCTVTVDIRTSAPGVFSTTSGDLTSSAGNSGPASADLTVDSSRPGFLKTFTPWTVSFGGRATLVLTIDNTLNGNDARGISFTDNLPAGMTVASPANASTTCSGGILSAPAGGSSISYSPAFFGNVSVPAGASCTVSVDVRAGAVGWLENTTGELTSFTLQGQLLSSGFAGESLNVTIDSLALTKSFVDDPVAPGENVTLEYTIRNLDRSFGATSIAFTDDLDSALSGLTANAVSGSLPCGTGSDLTGTSILSLSGGNLGPGETCTFSVQLTVPPSAPSGAFPSTTSDITGEVDGQTATGGPASELLFVAPVPQLSKSFVDDPVGAGGSVSLEFTITNSSATSDATSISFSDVLSVILPTASNVPADGFCGPNSTMAFTPLTGFNAATLAVSEASLGPAESCTFGITLDVADGATAGIYTNTTTAITAIIDEVEVTGPEASDDLEVVAAPVLRKEFVDDPVPAGGSVMLEFTLIHDELASTDAADITFTDDLDATLSGLVATGLPMSDVCGTGSSIDGTSTLTFSGGILAPGESCSFTVILAVPADAVPGSYPNTTSAVEADLGGITALSIPGSDDLQIAGLTLTKSFTDDPVLPGGVVTLEFAITNSNPTGAASQITFMDDLSDMLSGVVANGLPLDDICGAGSFLVGAPGNTLLFSGGTLASGESCTFATTLTIPVTAASGAYVNRTESFRATYGNATSAFDNASDVLTVESELLSFTKEFVDDPATPGATTTLRFSVTNLSAHLDITDVAFTDDLDAVISGLTATGLPASACGGTLSGSSVIALSGGALAASSSCSFDVTLSVPSTAVLGDVALNVTSPITGNAGGSPVTGIPASDELTINFLELSKAFDDSASPGGSVGLTFNITNLSSTESAADLSFADDLSGVMTGLVATGTPLSDVCGTGSVLDGTSFLTFTGGSLLPDGSCTFSVNVEVPASAQPGTYLNKTTELRVGSIPSTPAATATLTVTGNEGLDEDRDGVPDDVDACPGTVIPEGVPTVELGVNRFALVDDDLTFDTVRPKGNGPEVSFTVEDTAGCSCEQIIEKLELGEGHTMFGCSLGIMREWSESH